MTVPIYRKILQKITHIEVIKDSLQSAIEFLFQTLGVLLINKQFFQ